jgi:integrase
MANLKLFTKGSKSPSNIYIRLHSGRNLDISSRTNLTVNPAHFDNSKSNYRNIATVKNRAILRSRLEKLKVYVVEQYNEAYMVGDAINREWLENTVGSFFNRPKQEINHAIETHFLYFTDFASWWVENKAKTWRTSRREYLNHRALSQYERLISIVKKLELKKKTRLKIKDFGEEVINDLAEFMEEEKFSGSTLKRHIGRTKFFIHRANELGVKTDPSSAAHKTFISKDDSDIMMPYLNEVEIEKIFNLDLSADPKLDNIRDNAIIGCWTGLRISDFNHNLDLKNIDSEYIKIKTKKTGVWVTIPLHPQVKSIIKKRFGLLPNKMSDPKFNIGIKIVCMLADIDEEIKGGIIEVDKKKKTKRKVIGVHPKYKLISSHTCRRSFATNLHGKVPNSVIMSCAGWSSETMMLNYIKKTKKEHADTLKAYWDNAYKNQ